MNYEYKQKWARREEAATSAETVFHQACKSVAFESGPPVWIGLGEYNDSYIYCMLSSVKLMQIRGSQSVPRVPNLMMTGIFRCNVYGFDDELFIEKSKWKIDGKGSTRDDIFELAVLCGLHLKYFLHVCDDTRLHSNVYELNWELWNDSINNSF